MEKVIAHQLFAYFNLNNLFYEFQFGFRPNHSTIHPLIHFINYINQAHSNNEHVISVFIDLKKAFDTVNHEVLLQKLKYYGIRGISNTIFRSYLANRKQFVSINSVDSNHKTINIGVPKG